MEHPKILFHQIHQNGMLCHFLATLEGEQEFVVFVQNPALPLVLPSLYMSGKAEFGVRGFGFALSYDSYSCTDQNKSPSFFSFLLPLGGCVHACRPEVRGTAITLLNHKFSQFYYLRVQIPIIKNRGLTLTRGKNTL